MNYSTNYKYLIFKTAFFLFLFLGTNNLFAQDPLSDSALEQIKQDNKQNKRNIYDGVKIRYEVVINSVKVSAEDSTGVVQDIVKIPGGVECKFTPKYFSLIVKADKTNKYLSIVEIQNILVAHHLHLMTFQEILYKN